MSGIAIMARQVRAAIRRSKQFPPKLSCRSAVAASLYANNSLEGTIAPAASVVRGEVIGMMDRAYLTGIYVASRQAV